MNLLDSLEKHFTEFEKSLNGDAKHNFHIKRKEAVAQYQKQGIPSSSQEQWKYTDPSVFQKNAFPVLNKQSTEGGKAIKDNQILLIDGHFAAKGNLPSNLKITSLKQAQKESGNTLSLIEKHLAQHASCSESFVAINTALSADALVLIVEDGQDVKEVVELINISTPASNQKTVLPRILVVAGRNSEIKIVEKLLSENNQQVSFINSVIEFAVDEDARVAHYRVQNESTECLMVTTIAASLADRANFSTYTFSFGGSVVRNHVNVILNGKDCNVTMNGLTAIAQNQHVDNQTLLDNKSTNCQSLELYKGIYADKSEGVFSGTIIVRPDAQKTNAIQSNRSLLLSDSARVNSQPQLKIWADDVKCTHGATIGQLDEDAMFYLKSRGISETNAKVMLIHAFASEIISAVSVEELRKELELLLLNKLKLEN